jgi:hypothetical protein
VGEGDREVIRDIVPEYEEPGREAGLFCISVMAHAYGSW